MKVSTLVRIANEIRKERGDAPSITMDELFSRLQDAAGNCRTKQEARAAILQEIWLVRELSPV